MLVETQDDWNVLYQYIDNTQGRTYIDLETTGFDPHTEKLVMITVSQVKDGSPNVFVIDARKPLNGAQNLFIRHLIQNTELVGHNLAFDLSWLYHHFHHWPERVWDTMITEQVLKGRGLSSAKADGISFGLKQLAKDYAHTDLDKETRDYFIGLDTRDEWHQPFPEDAVTYAQLDVEVLDEIYWGQRYEYDAARTCNFHNLGQRELRKAGLSDCIDLENRAVVAFSHMKYAGMPVNVGEWRDVISEKAKEADQLKCDVIKTIKPVMLDRNARLYDDINAVHQQWLEDKAAFKATLEKGKIRDGEKQWKLDHPEPPFHKINEDFNLGSPTQLMELFEELGLKVRNTAKETLKQVDHPVVQGILDWREAEKFVTSFGDAVLDNLNPVTHRIHPDWQQIGADTGRSSCQRPNLQQIPARTETGKKLRHAVQTDPGRVFCDADFSSQELVILAVMSGEPEMLSAFERGEDLHARTAILMFNLPADTNTKQHTFQGLKVRDIAKSINYGIAYGMTKYRLGKLIHTDYDTAQGLIDKWYAAFPKAKAWLDKRKQQVSRGEWYSETLHGWVRRYRPLDPEPVKPGYGRGDWKQYKEAHREWEMEKNGIENQMMNSPIQGTGAGMTKLALTLFFDRAIMHPSNEYRITGKVQIVAAIHDEILVECNEEDAGEVSRLLATCMDEAERTLLNTGIFPRSEVNVDKYWNH